MIVSRRSEILKNLHFNSIIWIKIRIYDSIEKNISHLSIKIGNNHNSNLNAIKILALSEFNSSQTWRRRDGRDLTSLLLKWWPFNKTDDNLSETLISASQNKK